MWRDFKKKKLEDFNKAVKEKKVDEPIIKLLRKINKNSDVVTTSSCSGRIVLLEVDLIEGKKGAKFYKKWHRKVDPGEVEMALIEHTGKKSLWFRLEPFILHVTAKNLDSAKKFMKKMRTAGIKRGGIQSIGKTVVMEFHGTDYVVIPVDFVSGEWTKILLLCNKMLDRNFKVLKKLEKTF